MFNLAQISNTLIQQFNFTFNIPRIRQLIKQLIIQYYIKISYIKQTQTQMDTLNMRKKMLKPVSSYMNSHPRKSLSTYHNCYNMMLVNGPNEISSQQKQQKTYSKYAPLEIYINQREQKRNPQQNKSIRLMNYSMQKNGHNSMVQEFIILMSKYQNSTNGINQQSIRLAIQQVLGNYQMQVVRKTVGRLLNKQILRAQTKITICSELLSGCLSLIKNYNLLNTSKKLGNPFVKVNTINRSIMEYIKSKYPRNNSVSTGGLQNQFDKINYSNIFQNDMLVNAGFTFTDANQTRIQILDKAKLFINRCLQQTNQHYIPFCDLLNSMVNDPKTQHQTINKDNKNKASKIKLSRKLPQDTQKYYQFGIEDMKIQSPQLFRVIIKWIQEMQQVFNNPSDVITNLRGIKYIRKNNTVIEYAKICGQLQFDQIQSRRFQDLRIQIIEKIMQIRDKEYNVQIKQLLAKLNDFNDNLIKILTVRSPKQKYIDQEEAEVLKFSKFNAMFLEWLIMQKFIIIIKTFSKISAYFQTKTYKKLDFVNFNVFDLLRSSYTGKINQILETFNKLKQLQANDVIQIVRIRNRFSTPLNDVLINFKMKKSFIICQLQLILSDTLLEGEQKLKYFEDMNHIIYELQRSPYGSMSEMALVVDHYDPGIFYQKKINFSKDWATQQICRQGFGQNFHHQFMQIKYQLTPFVCAWCVKFYSRLDNHFEYHKCVKCGLQKCKACVFKENPAEQRRVYVKNFAKCFLGFQDDLDLIDELKDDDYIDNFFLQEETNFIDESYIKIRDHLNINHGGKIQDLQQLLQQNQKYYGLKITEPFYCYLLKFSNGISDLKVLKYENYDIKICLQANIQNLNSKQVDFLLQKQQKTRLEKHDALFFFKKKVYFNNKANNPTFLQRINLYQTKNVFYVTNANKRIKIQNKKLYKAVLICTKMKKYLLELKKISYTKDDKNQQSQQFLYKQQQIKRVLKNIISKCKKYKLQRHNFQVQGLNFNDRDLEEILEQQIKQETWPKQVLVINLSVNKIKNPQFSFKYFENVKELYLTNNLILTMDFIKLTKNLKILDLSENSIKEIPKSINQQSSKNLIVLKLTKNQIQQFLNLNLVNLEQLYINRNKIGNFQQMFKSNLPQLLILDISSNSNSTKFTLKWKDFEHFPKLRKLQAKKINILIQIQKNGIKQCFNLQWLPKIQYIDLSQNRLGLLNPILQNKLRQIKLGSCSIEHIHEIFTNKLTSLKVIELQNNQITQMPPNLWLPELQNLRLSNNKIKTLQNFNKAYFPKLESLQLQSNGLNSIEQLATITLLNMKILSLQQNSIQIIPILNFPNLEILKLNSNKLKNAQALSKCLLPLLKYLYLNNNDLQTIPCVDLPSLLQLDLFKNKLSDLQNFAKSKLPKIAKLALFMNKLQKINYQISFQFITSLLLSDNSLTNLDGISHSKLNNVKLLTINSNFIARLPILKMQKLEVFNATRNRIQYIDQLNNWKTPKLRTVDLRFNIIKHISALYGFPIHSLDISNNQLQDLTEFSSKSKLLMLRKINACNNKKLTKLGGNFQGFPRLEQLVINGCSLQHFDELSIKRNFNSLNNVKQQSVLKNLRLISFEQNKITHIPQPQSLNHLQSLQKLMLRFNQIKAINYHFKSLKSLKIVYLSNNQIQKIEPEYFDEVNNFLQISFSRSPISKLSFTHTTKLKSLTLNNCQITESIISKLYLPFLKQLFLIKNQLQTLNFLTVPGAFIKLKKFYAEQNKIKIIPVLNLPQLIEMVLLYNPLVQISDLLQSTLPSIKLLILSKKKKNKLKPKNNKKEKKQSVEKDQAAKSQINQKELTKVQEAKQSNNNLLNKNINEEESDSQQEQQNNLELLSRKSSNRQESDIQPQKWKQIKQKFQKIYPKVVFRI